MGSVYLFSWIWFIIRGKNMKSAFENISDMNTAYGNEFGCAVTLVDGKKEITEEGAVRLFNQVKNLDDEAQELREDGFDVLLADPQSATGRKEMFDAIADLLVFAHGAGHMLGEDITDKSREDGMGEPLLGFEIDELRSPEGQAKIHILLDEAREKNIPELTACLEMMTKIDSDDEAFFADFEIVLKAAIADFKENVKTRNFEESLEAYDGICDMLEFFFNLKRKPEYTIDLLIDRVTESNMSKICKNAEEVADTIEFYRKKGVEVYSKESPLLQEDGSPYLLVCSSKEQIVREFNEDKGAEEDKVYRANKVLKNVHWFEPNLSDF